jgi:tRNA-uridine 2-sulfurtransferase
VRSKMRKILGIPFYVFDFEESYKRKVVDYMVQGYKTGITPNPDVMCNKEIKFGLFLDKALRMGADKIATGHYVKIQNSKFKIQNDSSKSKSTYALYQAKDLNKDQTYFLWTLTQKQLKHCLFPLGNYKKLEVRKLAKRFDLHNYNKKDSQGICFLGKVTLQDFLKNYIPPKKGKVLTTDGKVLGEHNGFYYYTIGQRHIRLGNVSRKGLDPKPFYVSSKSSKDNTIVVAEGFDNPDLRKNHVFLKELNFLSKTINKSNDIFVRLRYRQPLFRATLEKKTQDRFKVDFSKPQNFVASGQSAVFYNKAGEMLGGGVIK